MNKSTKKAEKKLALAPMGMTGNVEFPWWVACPACGIDSHVSHLDWCAHECLACKAMVQNPWHIPFHLGDECFAPPFEETLEAEIEAARQEEEIACAHCTCAHN